MGSDDEGQTGPFLLGCREMAQPHAEGALALGENSTPTAFTPLGLGLSAFDAKMCRKETPLPRSVLASLFAHPLCEPLKCDIRSLPFLVFHRGLMTQICLEASLRFSGAYVPISPLPSPSAGRPGGNGKGSCSAWPLQPL